MVSFRAIQSLGGASDTRSGYVRIANRRTAFDVTRWTQCLPTSSRPFVSIGCGPSKLRPQKSSPKFGTHPNGVKLVSSNSLKDKRTPSARGKVSQPTAMLSARKRGLAHLDLSVADANFKAGLRVNRRAIQHTAILQCEARGMIRTHYAVTL
jgi:hypothetical protein